MPPVDGWREAELLRAARRLLRQCVNLDAVQVLHAEVVRSLGQEATLPVPTRYASNSEARAQQERLQCLIREHTPQYSGGSAVRSGSSGIPPASHRLQSFLQRQPRWAPRAAAAALLVLLTLRYAWAVTHQDWARQHPEGSWISRYYAGTKFEGNPMLRYDVGINYDFGNGGPIRTQAKDRFSIRWDTCLRVTREVIVPLTLQADDSAQLFVDGTPQIQVAPGPGAMSGDVTLKPGIHQVRVDFVERTGTALVRLEGLDLEGSDAVTFQRPRVDGLELTCAGE